jgi:hypothetical protein
MNRIVKKDRIESNRTRASVAKRHGTGCKKTRATATKKFSKVRHVQVERSTSKTNTLVRRRVRMRDLGTSQFRFPVQGQIIKRQRRHKSKFRLSIIALVPVLALVLARVPSTNISFIHERIVDKSDLFGFEGRRRFECDATAMLRRRNLRTIDERGTIYDKST